MFGKNCSRVIRAGLGMMLVFCSGTAGSQIYNEESLKFSQVINWIDKYYVDDVDQKKIVETAIIKMLHSLDPHSSYLTRDEVQAMNEPLQGNFEGIGVSFNILDDTIFIISPIPGGPSEKVGIMAGDRIVKIGSENVGGVGIRTSDVYDKLRGKKGTKVGVSIVRRSVPGLLDFTITRDKIPIFSVDADYMLDDKTGYIKINRFAYTTPDEFRDALGELKKQGAENLVLDLAGNGGGYLDVAIKIADEFLDDGKLIVYTEGANSPKSSFTATGRGGFQNGKLVIIVDEGTASASEIVAGAIQDWDRGIIVGRRSFGKGLVQRPLKLIDSSMIRLTIARYYTPSGRLIQKPYSDGYDSYAHELINRFDDGELSGEDKATFADSLRYETLTGHRTVYGGGGIMPDFFVPIDTTYISDYYRMILNRGIFNTFVLGYVDRHRGELNAKFPNFESFNSDYTVSPSIMDEMTRFAADEGLEYDADGFETSEEYLELLVKAYIARDLWTTSAFYEVVNQVNPAVLKAKEVLDDAGSY